MDIVIPNKNDPLSLKLFTSFCYSMHSLNKYAIARYTPRNNKNGVSPKMVTLIPHFHPEQIMFYLAELPTVEDVRDFPFNSLPKATEKQK